MENSESQMDHLKVFSKNDQILPSEIECLQEDINALVQNINSFVLDETKNSESANYEYTNDNNTDEKEDTENEKDLGDVVTNDTAVEPCNTNAELEIADVDWSVAGPVVQKHVADLVKIHTLNTAASALIRRMKQLAITKSINDLSDHEEDNSATSNLDSNL
ncbi:hypothetical protein CBL_11218 [Carabus blaptoides fortunei]